MLLWYTLPVPGITAITNRLWRGEGMIPRWQWYGFMVILAVAVSGAFSQWPLYLTWLVYFLGYALLPWQAMFSAITGAPPSRQDPWYINWLQTLTYRFCQMQPGGSYTPTQWRTFGIVYGTMRAGFMLPGVFALAWYAHSLVSLSGILCLCMGLVYYGAYRLSEHFSVGTTVAVPLAEMTMGWWHGTYMLITATVI